MGLSIFSSAVMPSATTATRGPRATWTSGSSADPENARQLVAALREFGFGSPDLTPELILDPKRMLRMGVPPLRLEILTTISGVDFADCYPRRVVDTISGVEVDLIHRDDLKKNKAASGRLKDLDDLQHLSRSDPKRSVE